MTLEIRGYLLRGHQLRERLEINGGISPCGQATQSSEHECATAFFFFFTFTAFVGTGCM